MAATSVIEEYRNRWNNSFGIERAPLRDEHSLFFSRVINMSIDEEERPAMV